MKSIFKSSIFGLSFLLFVSCANDNDALLPESKSITETNQNLEKSSFRISGLRLIDADKDEVLFNLGEASFIDLDNLPPNLTIEAITVGNVGSVVFELGAIPGHSKIENIKPYALFGDKNGDFNGGSLPTGGTDRTITATPYSGKNGTGKAGKPFKIPLTVLK